MYFPCGPSSQETCKSVTAPAWASNTDSCEEGCYCPVGKSFMTTNVFHGKNAPVSCVGGCFSQETRFQRIVTRGKFYE